MHSIIFMKKLIILSALLFSIHSFGQLGLSTGFGKWRAGGGLGVNFGDNSYFGLSVYPQLGYLIAPKLETGVTAGYQYSSWKEAKSNLFSFGPYLNFYPFSGLFLRSQYEYFTGKTKSKFNSYSTSYDEDALWLGGGYRSGGRVSFYAGAMYNVLWDKENSIFSNGVRPVAGVSIGF